MNAWAWCPHTHDPTILSTHMHMDAQVEGGIGPVKRITRTDDRTSVVSQTIDWNDLIFGRPVGVGATGAVYMGKYGGSRACLDCGKGCVAVGMPG